MAEVYDDFDKRVEHQRRFGEVLGQRNRPSYSAPVKHGHKDGHDEFAPDLQRSLTEDLLSLRPEK